MAKPNYNQQKKQKELARQARQNEKRLRRQSRNEAPATTAAADLPPPGSTSDGG